MTPTCSRGQIGQADIANSIRLITLKKIRKSEENEHWPGHGCQSVEI